MASSPSFFRRIVRILGRLYPGCATISQAVAFNLFLAFFPTLLLAVAVASSSLGSLTTLFDLINDFTNYLPPGSRQIVAEFLVQRAPHAWKWALVGWAGTLLAGSQVMKLIMDGIHQVYGDTDRFGFWHRQVRGLFLLLGTIAPLLAASVLGVFGRPLRRWLTDELGRSHPLYGLWKIFFAAAAILLSLIALAIIYRVARPQEDRLVDVLPGAAIATMLWWIIDMLFGIYVRRVPYTMIYGGLAAVIGLLIWMNLSAVVIFLGAACNAELASSKAKG
ncbi:MAG TPA: YihY/virulence factor BrkB family protein [Terriglobales bacterium]|nr:YihY/virulence factor BrkB family protein [Terriglobales bacterium]